MSSDHKHLLGISMRYLFLFLLLLLLLLCWFVLFVFVVVVCVLFLFVFVVVFGISMRYAVRQTLAKKETLPKIKLNCLEVVCLMCLGSLLNVWKGSFKCSNCH